MVGKPKKRADAGTLPASGADPSRLPQRKKKKPASEATPNSGGGACGGNQESRPKKKSKYDFSKFKNNTGDAVRTLIANAPTSNIPAKCTVFGGILAVVRINPNTTGWYKGLDTGLALKKALNMTSFPMNGNPGQTKEFGHYGIYEDPHHAFDQDPGGQLDKSSMQTVQDLAGEFGVLEPIRVGRPLPPTAQFPKGRDPKDFSGPDWTVGKLSSSFNIEVSDASKATPSRPMVNLVDHVGEYAVMKIFTGLQHFALQVEAVDDMKDMTFLEEIQKTTYDLVPARYETVDKYLRSRGDYGMLVFSTGAKMADY